MQAVVVWYGAEDRLPGRKLSIAHYLALAKIIPPYRIANGDADPVISTYQAQKLRDALVQEGAMASLTILPGAGHEDGAFMKTQMPPTFAFLDKTFSRETTRDPSAP